MLLELNTINFPNLYENFGMELYLNSQAFDVQYVNINPKKVIMTPTGNTAA